MQLPIAASATLAYFTFDAGSVQVSSANTTPTVDSALDQTSGLGAVQLTTANQPQYVRSLYGVPSFYDSLSFNGTSAVLAFDSLASKVAGGSFTVYIVASTTTPATANMDLFSFGKTATDGYIQAFISGSAAGFLAKDDSATVVNPGTAGTITSAVNLYTLVRDAGAGTIALRLNGTQILSASASGVYTPSTFSFGALRNNSTTTRFLNGNLYECAVFAGAGISMTNIETYFKAKYLNGLNRVV